jgi:hypothetical protein
MTENLMRSGSGSRRFQKSDLVKNRTDPETLVRKASFHGKLAIYDAFYCWKYVLKADLAQKMSEFMLLIQVCCRKNASTTGGKISETEQARYLAWGGKCTLRVRR